MIVNTLRVAELEATDAAAWYDDCRPGLGDEFLEEFKQTIARIRNELTSFSKMEGYHGKHDVRRCVLKRFPYLVVFVRSASEALVVAVAHARRRPLYWLDRLD